MRRLRLVSSALVLFAIASIGSPWIGVANALPNWGTSGHQECSNFCQNLWDGVYLNHIVTQCIQLPAGSQEQSDCWDSAELWADLTAGICYGGCTGDSSCGSNPWC